jgi:hypothetical protein
MKLYLAGAFLVFVILLHAFVKDNTTPKTHVGSWITIVVATAVWPIVLPSIVRKKLSKVSLKTSSLAEKDLQLDQEIN